MILMPDAIHREKGLPSTVLLRCKTLLGRGHLQKPVFTAFRLVAGVFARIECCQGCR